MAFLKVTVLVWMDILAVYAVSTLITYLTDVWKLNYTHAAAIVNVFWGSTAIMPFTMQYIVDTFMGNHWMVLLSNFAYTLGLGFLTMSTPPVLSGVAGNCNKYKPECTGIEQRILFYTALTLLAIGLSGHLTSLEKLIEEHKRLSPNNGSKNFYLGLSALILVPLIGAIVIPFIKPWSIRFGITATCSVSATIIFLTGFNSNCDEAPRSPLTTVFRVIVAAASKSFHKCPKDASHLYEVPDQNGHSYKIPHTPRLRFLDKAAILLPNHSPQKTSWTLCSVTQVEETKSVVCMIPLCTTFFLLGVVSSIGNSYFLEQANRMNRKVGRLSVPLTVLIFFRDQAKAQFASCYRRMANNNGFSLSNTYTALVGIAVSMLFAVHCCITAAKVENRRLDVVTRHGLLYKPNDKIPMSMFWLLPQFLLLGGLDGISRNSIGLFFSSQGPASMDRYMTHFAMAVFGVGTMGNVVSVCLVDKISSRGGNPSWFQDTLNRSRLDKYYWVLATLSAANFVLYILLAVWYDRKVLRLENVELPKHNQSVEQSDD
ncbi:Proton-dependent oligopeptide transporter family [Trema orientale]|uniref:Proton-dependent oligopeptide transporter family n=1 Tax=Trema orientale TaxID=63057 RepID=A0A2P5F4A2_TREOI|nr:Proton-dependent oligopeptide transporter family [Trema orientale]